MTEVSVFFFFIAQVCFCPVFLYADNLTQLGDNGGNCFCLLVYSKQGFLR